MARAAEFEIPEEPTWDQARTALSNVGTEALPLLIEALAAEETYLRYHAVEVVRDIGRPDRTHGGARGVGRGRTPVPGRTSRGRRFPRTDGLRVAHAPRGTMETPGRIQPLGLVLATGPLTAETDPSPWGDPATG